MKNKLSLAAAFSAMFVLIFASEEVMESSRYALNICANSIVPSLLPFFIVSILLNRLGLPYYLGKLLARPASRLFCVSGAGATAFFVGLCGGYPLGAAYIVDMAESALITEDEAERLLSFCNNSGPAFIVGVIGGGVFHSAKAGLFLYFIHALAAVASGLLLRRKGLFSEKMPSFSPLPFSKALPEAVQQAVSAALNVCGFVVCFSVFTGLLDTLGLFSQLAGSISELTGTELHWARAFITGVFEIGSAAGAMTGLQPRPVNLALAAGILSWGGISVHFQTAALLCHTKIKGTLHFAGRLLSAVAAFIMAFIGSAFFF